MLRSLRKWPFIFFMIVIGLAPWLLSHAPFTWATWPLAREAKTLVLSRQAALRNLDVEYHQRFVAQEDSANGKHRIVFVAAAGGGQRAAIWTEAVLRNLQHELPGFTTEFS
jgi:hypothetical protein